MDEKSMKEIVADLIEQTKVKRIRIDYQDLAEEVPGHRPDFPFCISYLLGTLLILNSA